MGMQDQFNYQQRTTKEI